MRGYSEAISAGGFATVKGYALSEDDRLRADLIERLMCDFRVDVGEVCRRHGRSTGELGEALARIDEMAADGIVRHKDGVIEIAPDAQALARAVAATFDAYLAASTRTHSPAL